MFIIEPPLEAFRHYNNIIIYFGLTWRQIAAHINSYNKNCLKRNEYFCKSYLCLETNIDVSAWGATFAFAFWSFCIKYKTLLSKSTLQF